MNSPPVKLYAVVRETLASDPEVLERLASGDMSALGELYDRYQADIRRFVARATCDAEDVDDLVHATFLTASRSASRYDGRAACKSWLIGIAVQLLKRRRHNLGRFFRMLTSLRTFPSAAADPRATLHARSDLDRALRQISEAKRVTLQLAEVEGLSCPEIAELLSVPVGTVWTRLHSARRELRQLLEGGGEK